MSPNGELDSNELTGSFNYRIFLAGQIHNSEGFNKKAKKNSWFRFIEYSLSSNYKNFFV